jgi:small-conductance mechanosensitive channel
MKKKFAIILVSVLVLAIPAFAVFNERDFAKTLSILRSELHQEILKMEQMRERLNSRNEAQHEQLVEMTRKCNELALILYSQNQDYTFDLTYALEEVTRQYNDYEKQRLPFDEIVMRMNLEIERYEYLAEALRRLPPVLGKVDAVPDSLSAVMDTILVREATHHHEHGYDFVGSEHPDDDGHEHELGDGHEYEEEPFYLDAQGQADRDSCLAYTLQLLELYTQFRDKVVIDNDHYEGMNSRLEESYNYARKRYEILQKMIFVYGQDNYLKVLTNFPAYSKMAFQDARRKYSLGKDGPEADALSQSEWRGPLVSMFIVYILGFILLATLLSNLAIRILRKYVPRFQTEEFRLRSPLVTLLCGVLIFTLTVMIASLSVEHNFFQVASRLLLLYAWMLIAILISLLIRVPAANIRQITKLYLPVVLLGLIVITFRVIFIPNRLVNLIFPPIMLGFTIWQYFACRKAGSCRESRADLALGWVTFAVMLGTLVMVMAGYVLLGIQVFIWWLFQLTAIETIIALYVLFGRYEKKYLDKRKLEYKKTHTIYEPGRKDAYIAVTWLADFFQTALLPILAILSVPMCIWLAADIFDLTEICKDIFYQPFFDFTDKSGNEILQLSLYKLVLASTIFFLFRYLSYILKAFYRRYRFDSLARKEQKTYIHDNEINFTLANNVIGLLVWGSYIIFLVVLFKIPMGALSLVAAGLATGLGLAMKDILNNFIYGIQLMSGRLRVGDYIECDGIRGKVTSISYQTTQIQALDDTLVAFTNTTLFNKYFKNLTRSGAYEYLKVVVGVSYGTDVEKVRTVLSEALQKLQNKDKYGRNIVDPQRGVTVAFETFGDSSIGIALKQFVLVEERYGYEARVKELVYNTLKENGIEIPFPQRDVHIISTGQ